MAPAISAIDWLPFVFSANKWFVLPESGYRVPRERSANCWFTGRHFMLTSTRVVVALP